MTSPTLPDWVERELETAPIHIGKRDLARLLTRLYGPISHRTIEERPYVWRRFNNYAVTKTRPAVEDGYARFIAEPEYRGGRAKKTKVA
jgi:hypothetical protein